MALENFLKGFKESSHKSGGRYVYLPLTIIITVKDKHGKDQNVPLTRDFCVVVPPNFDPWAAARIMVHFHGLRSQPFDADKPGKPGAGTIEHFNFPAALPSDMVMLCPIGNRVHWDLDDVMGSSKRIGAFLKVFSKLSGSEYVNIFVSGHSAGGRALSKLLLGGNTGTLPVTEVHAYDALYSADVTSYTDWLRQPGRTLKVVSRSNDSIWSHALKIKNKAGKLTNLLSEEENHYRLVDSYMPLFLGTKKGVQ